MKPLVIGLTGGIGSGKSHIRNVLVSLGAEGIDADEVAHEVMAPGGSAFEPVLAAFGHDLVRRDGAIDRSRLGGRVFADPNALARLEALVHPIVGDIIAHRVAVSAAPVVVIEAIKLLESGIGRQLCDQVWVAQCSLRRQFARLKKSRGMDVEEARRRMTHQMTPTQMATQAQRVVNTDGTMAETAQTVLTAWVELGLPLPTPVIRFATLADAEGTAAVLNSIVREGGRTIAGRTFTPAQERAYLRAMPQRSFLNAALFGRVVAGFQVVEPYATFTSTMDHVATLGTYIIAAVRGRGLGHALSKATWEAARALGFSKFIITVRDDNLDAQTFYDRLGFRLCGRLARQAFVDGRHVDELLYELFLNDHLEVK